jgi:hypothetical protein
MCLWNLDTSLQLSYSGKVLKNTRPYEAKSGEDDQCKVICGKTAK